MHTVFIKFKPFVLEKMINNVVCYKCDCPLLLTSEPYMYVASTSWRQYKQTGPNKEWPLRAMNTLINIETTEVSSFMTLESNEHTHKHWNNWSVKFYDPWEQWTHS